jgi:hypothetical protein
VGGVEFRIQGNFHTTVPSTSAVPRQPFTSSSWRRGREERAS